METISCNELHKIATYASLKLRVRSAHTVSQATYGSCVFTTGHRKHGYHAVHLPHCIMMMT